MSAKVIFSANPPTQRYFPAYTVFSYQLLISFHRFLASMLPCISRTRPRSARLTRSWVLSMMFISPSSAILVCLSSFFVLHELGVKADSFKAGDSMYINPMKLLPLSRFTEYADSQIHCSCA